MSRLAGTVVIALIGAIAWIAPCDAQTGAKSGGRGTSPGDSAGEQIKQGAEHIGEGAQRIGEDIKDGAISAWEAVKAGASAAADKFNERQAGPNSDRGPARSGDSDRR
jgi:hypothetical protein